MRLVTYVLLAVIFTVNAQVLLELGLTASSNAGGTFLLPASTQCTVSNANSTDGSNFTLTFGLATVVDVGSWSFLTATDAGFSVTSGGSASCEWIILSSPSHTVQTTSLAIFLGFLGVELTSFYWEETSRHQRGWDRRPSLIMPETAPFRSRTEYSNL